MSHSVAATTQPRTYQKVIWHLMNGIAGVAFLGVWQAESLGSLGIGLAAGVTLLFLSHRYKQRGYRNAGEERLRVGAVLPVAPPGSSMYAVGIAFFVICGFSMLAIPEFSQLMRIAMTILCLGLAVCFAALINTKFRRPALSVFALTMVTAGVLFAIESARKLNAGGEHALVESTKSGLLAAAILLGGCGTLWGLIRGRTQEQETPLYDNGMHSQWGFLPWSMLNLELNETEEPVKLQATLHNGWSLTMPVPEDQLDPLKQLLAELADRNRAAEPAPDPA